MVCSFHRGITRTTSATSETNGFQSSGLAIALAAFDASSLLDACLTAYLGAVMGWVGGWEKDWRLFGW